VLEAGDLRLDPAAKRAWRGQAEVELTARELALLEFLLVAAITWVVVGRALAPVEAIRAEVDAISAAALHRRVQVPPADDEIGRLARTMNRMLGRLEQAQARQRRLVSDASHELRSPVAAIRQHAEVALTHPDRTTTAELAATVLAEDLRLQRLAEDLLLLTRADEHTLTLRRRPVDLDDLVFEEARRLRDGTGLRVDTGAVSAGRVDGDAAGLRRVLRNLGENAARHAVGRLAFSLAERDGQGAAGGRRRRAGHPRGGPGAGVRAVRAPGRRPGPRRRRRRPRPGHRGRAGRRPRRHGRRGRQPPWRGPGRGPTPPPRRPGRLNRPSAAFSLRSGAPAHAGRDPLRVEEKRMQRRTRWMAAAGLAVAVAVAALSGAAAAGGDADQELTGATRDRAAAAALAATGGGTVLETETGDDGAAYGVEVRLPDGRQLEVTLDQSFKVVDQEPDEDDRPGP
jgi:HAMP domain-containing protein